VFCFDNQLYRILADLADELVWISLGHPGTSVENKLSVLTEFYRGQFKDRIENLMNYWQSHVDVEVTEWGVKKMKTKRGSCNLGAKRIWLNLDLLKSPSSAWNI